MGDKIESRRAMQAAEVPVVPGTVDAVGDASAAEQHLRAAHRLFADLGAAGHERRLAAELS